MHHIHQRIVQETGFPINIKDNMQSNSQKVTVLLNIILMNVAAHKTIVHLSDIFSPGGRLKLPQFKYFAGRV